METIYMGMDIHRKFSFVSVMDQEGNEIRKRRLEHDDMESFRSFFKAYKNANAAMEATCGWMWIADELEELGLNVTLAHSSGVKAISASHKKTDKIDAKTLAQLLRTNYLPKAYLAPREVRSNREILRYRTALIKMRTMVKNRVHSQFIKLNYKPSPSDIFGKKGRAIIEGYELPAVHRTVIEGWLLLIDFLDIQIKEVEQEIKSRLKDDNRALILQSLSGIGYLTAYTLISEIGYISRFKNGDHFSSYCGLVPSTHQSADKTRHGKLISGRVTLKWNLVEATHIAVRCDSYFATLYHKHLKTKSKGRALIVCAHKMAKIIYKMLKEERPYRPKLAKGEKEVISPPSPKNNHRSDIPKATKGEKKVGSRTPMTN